MPHTPTIRPRVLLIDDEAEWLTTATAWLTIRGYTAIGVRSIEAAEESIAVSRCDVVVLNVWNRTADPWDFLVRVACVHQAQVILLSGPQTLPFVVSALRQGKAVDFLDAPSPRLAALRHAIDHAWLGDPGPEVGDLPPLTSREQDLVDCLSLGMNNKTIANRLAISDKTVRNLLTKLYGKLQVSSRTQALVLLQQAGMAAI